MMNIEIEKNNKADTENRLKAYAEKLEAQNTSALKTAKEVILEILQEELDILSVEKQKKITEKIVNSLGLEKLQILNITKLCSSGSFSPTNFSEESLEIQPEQQ